MIDRGPYLTGGTHGKALAGRPAVLDAFAKQVAWCESLGSPFTARLLAILADDVANGGRAAEFVGSWTGDPVADALPLRLAGALHALVLTRGAPDLAACYPPQQGAIDAETLRSVLQATLVGHEASVRHFLTSPPQTNEVGRSAVLLGGFLTVAELTRLPLRLLEIGASAGLNLIWDTYRYRIGSASWGDPASPVVLAPEWQGGLPPLAAPLRVVARAACDRAPIDLENEDQRLRLRAYVWADQSERLQRLDAAIMVARREGYTVERADASAWVPRRLAAPAPGQATVLAHSIMWHYIPTPERMRIAEHIEAAGRRASESAPLAWLRFEPSSLDEKPELHLTLWPGREHRRLAIASPHGNAVTWL